MTKEEDRFVYFNRNPQGEHKKDCVCRAISTATGLKYNAVNKLLEFTAKENNCDKLCVCCYHKLLEDLFEYPVIYCDGETVNELANIYKYKRVIIRIHGHLTCAIMGNILDIWDCSGEIADCLWICD